MGLAVDVRVERGGFDVAAAFEAADGETLALLGPNGAGKSTLVEALAGVLPLGGGEIRLDRRRIDGLPPERRPIGVAFQDGLLFPTMSALENVAFPLRAGGTPRDEARARAAAVLGDVAHEVDGDARPAELSGGQARRVALARALVAAPRLLLLDEPLAAVDVGARAGLRLLLRRVTAAFDGVCVLVAHDPIDALTLADRVVVLEGGRVSQTGAPDDIRDAPRTPYAADLVGLNLFEGRISPLGDGAGLLATAGGSIVVPMPSQEAPLEVIATLSPTDVSLHLSRPEGSARNVFEGEVAEIVPIGERARVRLSTAPPLVAEVTRGSVDRLGLRPGTRVFASCKAVEVRLHVPDRETPGTLSG